MSKPKYLLNGFSFLYNAFRKDIHYEYVDRTPKHYKHTALEYYLNNFKIFRKLERSGELKDFDVIHINSWDGILLFDPKKKNQGQTTIAEAHGYFVGINFDATLRELPMQKRIPNYILKLLFDRKMRRRIKKYDIFYVAVPNMLEYAKKIRHDAKWLPNPVNTKVFRPNGPKIRLEGNPSIFFPTRLHAFKNPKFGIDLYLKIKKKYPGAKLHMIRYGSGADPLFRQFTKDLDPSNIIIHDKMDVTELSKYYRSADLILGQFNPVLATLGLVELEAMACGAPILTLDKYEIKTYPLDALEKLAFRMLEDKKFKAEYIKKNLAYISRVHSPESVAKMNIDNIRKFKKIE